jgi:hypothetical protein
MLTATVSGSFHRHMDAISSAVRDLAMRSVRVLSPADPRVVAAQGEFLFVASDRVRSVRLVQDRHLDCIRAADFLWLVCPDGYVGQSTSMEIGFAAGASVPIFATRAPSDLTLREYVTVARSIDEAVSIVRVQPCGRTRGGILVDPHATIQHAHQRLANIEAVLVGQRDARDSAAVYGDIKELRSTLALPTLTQ